jgi:hypothetical protein
MKTIQARVDLYRSLYWANQGLLNAVRALHEAEEPASLVSSTLVNHNLRRSQAIIEETRTVVNQILGEWIERKE